MARLDKVKLTRKRPGEPLEKMNVNAFDYQRDIGDYVRSGWEIATYVRGDATPGEEDLAKLESDINKHRLTDPEESRKRGDARRKFESRAVKVTPAGDTEPPAPDKTRRARRRNAAPATS